MPRKNKNRQRYNFPDKDQPDLSTESLDAEIDGVVEASNSAPTPAKNSIGRLKKDAEEKRKAAEVIKDIPQIFTPEQVAWVFDVYVGAICFIFSILLKCEFKALYEELQLDAEVKIAWAKPLARVASKYAPSEWAGMTAEIELIASVGIWTATAFGRSKKIAEQEKEKKESELREKRNKVTAVHAQTQAVQAVQ